ncbi:MAG: SpoVR family protein [Deltaproteobacteria bacterium]|nr:SpoVR family protein [Deltaproteobacteria bacterium]
MALFSGRFLREGRALPPELEEARVGIVALARGYGLDFFETIFEMCTYEEINMIASYGGFPTRYPHWRFGMEFIQMQKGYEYGLSKIYEMVINTNPSYAYLMDNNLAVDQKLVMAHVLGHVDFFKNNAWFAHTDRKMLDTMANHAAKVRRIMDERGVSEVERFLDLCLSLENLIDPYAAHVVRTRPREASRHEDDAPVAVEVPTIPGESYMRDFLNPPSYVASERARREEERDRVRSFPEEPVRDVLGFLLQHAKLSGWQRELLRIVRDEALYFAPQGMTKIMNEGWATYWHTTMMTQDILSDAEVVDYADHHSGTVAMQPGQLNPYRLGLELLRHIERRWDKGRFGKDWLDCTDPVARRAWDTGAGLGRAKLFEVRRTHNDISFLDTFLTEDFIREQGFFTTRYDSRAQQWVIDSREFASVKAQLLQVLASRGTPRVHVVDANAFNRGELRLVHAHEGLDIQMDWAERVLGNLALLWGRPVHLDTKLEDKALRLSHDGAKLTRTLPT